MARLTKEEREAIRSRDDHDIFYPYEVRRLCDDLDAADDENDRLHAYGEAHAEEHVKAKDELAEFKRYYRDSMVERDKVIAEYSAMLADRTKERDDARWVSDDLRKERDRLRAENERLRKAIETHRRLVGEKYHTYLNVDLDLYKALEGTDA